MAIVTNIEYGNDSDKIHPSTVLRCVAFIVDGGDGKRYIEVDTYGSASRINPEQPSQMTQFNEQAAMQLKNLIEEAFPTFE
jgi:hypothetical protein